MLHVYVCGEAPVRGSAEAAGYDLVAQTIGHIEPGERSAPISTGVRLVIPQGYYAEIKPRSGLAHRHGITVLAGVIDSDYRGEIKVILHCLDTTNGFSWRSGDRIAQLVFKRHEVVQFETVAELPTSNRGEGGFGSSGVSGPAASPAGPTATGITRSAADYE